MLKPITVILPAAQTSWEVWHCGNGSGTSCCGVAEDPAQGAREHRSVVIGLPARSCRTFAFSAPTEDGQVLRRMAFAHVEKRGLTNAGVEQTPFEYRIIKQRDGRSLISVDVVTPEAAGTLADIKARAVIPSARLFSIPENRLVIVEEQGRLVLCAGVGGRVVHTQIVATTRDFAGVIAPEIRIASLALRQQGIVTEIAGLEMWGEFTEAEARELSEELGLPVEIKARPLPETPALQREASVQLLPPAARQALRRRRLLAFRWVAVALLLVPLIWWIISEKRKLAALEAEAARIESVLNLPVDTGVKAEQDRIRAEHELVTAAQARWAALRLALEPRRYPAAHLDGLSRCLTAADVVLTRFETKVTEVTVAGTARSAMDAYSYFNAVSKDSALGVYSWSMVQPLIGADGAATFEMKGAMR
jgi:hypothetical protein